MALPIRRPSLLRKSFYPVATLIVAALFLAQTVITITNPARLSRTLARRLCDVRSRYIAEDVFTRALSFEPALRERGFATVLEGGLSSHPERRAIVALGRAGGCDQLVCRLVRGAQEYVFVANYSRGVVPSALGWALGQGDPDPDFDARSVVLRGESHVLSRDPQSPDVHPFRIPGAWTVMANLDIRVSTLTALRADSDMNLGNFRTAAELPLRELAEPTDLDDFELGRTHDGRFLAAFRSPHDMVVRIHGHLWLGRPDLELLVGTGGRDLVLLVDGNVYVRGSVRVLGPRDRITVVCGRPGFASFRDRNGDGRRDLHEPIVGAPPDGDIESPREGGGALYLGLRGPTPTIQAILISSHDAIVGPAGATIEGALLAGGRLIRRGAPPGALAVSTDVRFPAKLLPRPGIPVLPGTETEAHIGEVVLVGTQPRRE